MQINFTNKSKADKKMAIPTHNEVTQMAREADTPTPQEGRTDFERMVAAAFAHAPKTNLCCQRVHVELMVAAYARGVADEREACANVAKNISDKYAYGYYGQEVDTADEIAAAIRARPTPTTAPPPAAPSRDSTN